MAKQTYLKKQERLPIKQSNLTPKALRKQTNKRKEKNPKVSRRKEIIQIKAERNEKEMETTAKIDKTKSWCFEKINKTDKLLARLIKKKRQGEGEDANQ